MWVYMCGTLFKTLISATTMHAGTPHRQPRSMTNANKPELKDPPVSLKSPVWENYGFSVKHSDDRQRQVDRTKAICGVVSSFAFLP